MDAAWEDYNWGNYPLNPPLTFNGLGSAIGYYGTGNGNPQVGDQLYDGSGNPISGASAVLVSTNSSTDFNDFLNDFSDVQLNGGTVRFIGWNNSGEVVEVLDITVVPQTTTTTTTAAPTTTTTTTAAPTTTTTTAAPTTTTTTAAPTTTTTTTAAPIPYFVSNTGSDDVTTTGDINDPYASLDYAISQITNQDTIYLREGSYEFAEKEITNTGLSIQAYNSENVTFDGTRPIDDLKDTNVNSGNWEAYTTDIVTDTNQTISDKTLYRIKLRDDVEIWQLFHDRNEVINARFPSAQWDDETVYDRANWGHGYYGLNNNGDIKDSLGNTLGNGTSSPYYYENGEIVDVAQSGKSLYDFVTARQAIDSSFDLTGALANLNVGSFRTYTKKINSQTLDNANNLIRLSYDNVATWKTKHHYYYLENKLEYLNSENEWFFDNNTKYLICLVTKVMQFLTTTKYKSKTTKLFV